MVMITSPKRGKGFTLIEVLVTLLVLSVGLFGILAVIIKSLQMNSSSVYRTIASQQAYAMAETLRANPTAVGTANAASAVAFSTSGVAATTIDTTCLNATGCARNAFIANSLYMWNQQLAALLPQGQGTICQDSTPNDGTPANWLCNGPTGTQTPTDQNAPYVVKVCWNESRIAASSSVIASASGVTSGTGGALCTYTNL
jgi:type IV pilus assembly protein PilV